MNIDISFLLTFKTYNIYIYIFNYINIILTVYQQYQISIIDTKTIIYVNIIDL